MHPTAGDVSRESWQDREAAKTWKAAFCFEFFANFAS
jgi:hypothetical protein